jgi:hypothetical protein
MPKAIRDKSERRAEEHEKTSPQPVTSNVAASFLFANPTPSTRFGRDGRLLSNTWWDRGVNTFGRMGCSLFIPR